MDVKHLPTDLYVLFADLLHNSKHVTDILPYFIGHAKKVSKRVFSSLPPSEHLLLKLKFYDVTIKFRILISDDFRMMDSPNSSVSVRLKTGINRIPDVVQSEARLQPETVSDRYQYPHSMCALHFRFWEP